ncbi:hypothetical protein Taro_038678, partial [Colocasia esculenta]|nr:hypothetical protein [Colocasia esculenta]
MHAAAANQAGNDGLEGGIRGKLLGFQRDMRFFKSLFAFQSLRCCGDEVHVGTSCDPLGSLTDYPEGIIDE